MSIEQRLDADYKTAMRAKDSEKVACIRQLRSKVQETVNTMDFAGEVNDALYQRVIHSYSKSLRKGIEELKGGGDRGAALGAKYEAEIEYLAGFLPKTLGEKQTRSLVASTIAELGVSDPKQAGRVMGTLMKAHKDEVDASLVRRLVDEALG